MEALALGEGFHLNFGRSGVAALCDDLEPVEPIMVAEDAKDGDILSLNKQERGKKSNKCLPGKNFAGGERTAEILQRNKRRRNRK